MHPGDNLCLSPQTLLWLGLLGREENRVQTTVLCSDEETRSGEVKGLGTLVLQLKMNPQTLTPLRFNDLQGSLIKQNNERLEMRKTL